MRHDPIELSPEHRAFAEQAAEAGGFATISEYVETLVEADRRARVQERLDAFLLEGLEGPFTEWTEADTDRLKHRAAGH